jgi:cellulose synthase/poly-beta-1,6-N-acetylglucosamine synthase-like glycosyltransferase
MRPIAIPPYISSKYYLTDSPEKICNDIKLQHISIYKKALYKYRWSFLLIMKKIIFLRTLSSLASNQSKWSVEIIVVNNNSKDRTKELVEAAGVTCILETVQRISAARNAGLSAANGKYILTADADTIYPENWIDLMIAPMEDAKWHCHLLWQICPYSNCKHPETCLFFL